MSLKNSTLSCTGTVPGTPHEPHPSQEPPPLFLHRNRPRNPPGTPFLHRNPPLSCTGTPLRGPLPRPFPDPSCIGTLPLFCAGTIFLDHFLSPFVVVISRYFLQADVDVYPRLVVKSVDEEDRATPLPMAPSETTRTVDGRAPSLQDPPTWLLQSMLTITDMHSPATRQGGTFWYRDRTLTVRKGKEATTLQLRLPVACTDTVAELP